MRVHVSKMVWIGSWIQGYYGSVAATLTPSAPVPESEKAKFVHELGVIIKDCKDTELCKTVTVIEAAIHDYSQPSGQTEEHLKQTVSYIDATFKSELHSHIFVHIDPERSRYMKTLEEFASDPIWGREVASSFSTAMTDAEEAGICFATYRDTACVFHCMRVAEKGLIALANSLAVPVPGRTPFEYENWANIIDAIEKEIKRLEQALPKGQAKSDTLKFYSQAATQFFYFKNAWRNHVAH